MTSDHLEGHHARHSSLRLRLRVPLYLIACAPLGAFIETGPLRLLASDTAIFLLIYTAGGFMSSLAEGQLLF